METQGDKDKRGPAPTLSTRLYLSGFTEMASLVHVPGRIQYSASTQSPLQGSKPPSRETMVLTQ